MKQNIVLLLHCSFHQKRSPLRPLSSVSMEFRFKAINNQPPATAAAFSSDHPLQDDSTEAELVKQRIKEEILIREIASRRMLEAEIRRELIIEQELAMLRATGRTKTTAAAERTAFDEHFATRLMDLDQRLNHSAEQSSSRGLLAVPGSSSSLNWLPVPPFSELQKEEMKPLVDEKDNLTFLSKPDSKKFKTKRKAEANTDLIPLKFKKLYKEEVKFICSICKMTTKGENDFSAHLQGKKYMAKQGRQQPTDLQTGVDDDDVGLDVKSTEEPTLQNKDYFKFWCEICQIGTQSLVVMESHNHGRKHKARLLKLFLGKEDGHVDLITTTSL